MMTLFTTFFCKNFQKIFILTKCLIFSVPFHLFYYQPLFSFQHISQRKCILSKNIHCLKTCQRTKDKDITCFPSVVNECIFQGCFFPPLKFQFLKIHIDLCKILININRRLLWAVTYWIFLSPVFLIQCSQGKERAKELVF